MTETPRTGDRVRVTPKPFEGEMVCDGSQGRLIQVRDEQGRVNAFGPDYGTVEVLEPPLCTETEGATGIRCQQPTGHVGGHKGTTTEEQTAAVGYPLFVSWPAESEHPSRLSEPGPRVHAPAETSHEGVDACGRSVVHTGPRERCDAPGCKADVAARTARVFSSDGPEPPADAYILEYLEATEGRRFLKRFESAWLWVDSPRDCDPGGSGEWPPFHPGRYREVLS